MNITVHIAHVFHVKRLGKEVLQRGSASLSCCVPEDRPVSCQLGILVSWAPSDGAPLADNSAPPVSSCAFLAGDGTSLISDGAPPADNSALPVSSCAPMAGDGASLISDGAPPACDGARLTGDGVSPTSE